MLLSFRFVLFFHMQGGKQECSRRAWARGHAGLELLGQLLGQLGNLGSCFQPLALALCVDNAHGAINDRVVGHDRAERLVLPLGARRCPVPAFVNDARGLVPKVALELHPGGYSFVHWLRPRAEYVFFQLLAAGRYARACNCVLEYFLDVRQVFAKVLGLSIEVLDVPIKLFLLPNGGSDGRLAVNPFLHLFLLSRTAAQSHTRQRSPPLKLPGFLIQYGTR